MEEYFKALRDNEKLAEVTDYAYEMVWDEEIFEEVINYIDEPELMYNDETSFLCSFNEHKQLSKYSYNDLKFVKLVDISRALFFLHGLSVIYNNPDENWLIIERLELSAKN